MSQTTPLYDSYRTSVYVPTDRMTVSSSVRLPGSDLDFKTGQLMPERKRRSRVQGKRLEIDELTKQEKMMEKNQNKSFSWKKSILFIVSLFCLCGMILVSQSAKLSQTQTAINTSNAQIRAWLLENEALETQIAEASDSATICYAAARDLNMVPADRVEAIHLVAEDPRPRKTAQIAQAQAQQAQQEADVTASQGQGAQPTNIPAIASSNGQ